MEALLTPFRRRPLRFGLLLLQLFLSALVMTLALSAALGSRTPAAPPERFDLVAGTEGEGGSSYYSLFAPNDLPELQALAPDVALLAVATEMYSPTVVLDGTRYAFRSGARVSAGFFELEPLTLTRGSRFSGAEIRAGEPVMLISDGAAEILFGDADPVGQTLGLEAELAALERESTLLGLQNALAEADRALGTTERLFELGASSRSELEAARAAQAVARGALTGAEASGEVALERQMLAQEGARAAVAAAEQALAAARAQLRALELRAPLSGRVLSLRVDAGDTVEAGALLATLASPEDLRVEVPLGEAQGIGVGQRASITVADQTFAGSVTQVAAQAQTAEGGGAATVPVVVSFDETPQGLRIGASAGVALEVGRREGALYLPRGPFLSTGDERLAYVVEGASATRQTVRFGLVDGERVEVADGLTEGQRVVTSSYEAFKDRPTVRLAPEGELREP